MITIRNNIHHHILKIKKKYVNWAIYGTGDGAEKIWQELICLDVLANICCIVDNEEKVKQNIIFHGYKVTTLDKLPMQAEVILIGAELNHFYVAERVKKELQNLSNRNVIVIDPFQYKITLKEKNEFIAYISSPSKHDEFVHIDESGYQYTRGDSKVIAWYLPQFHQIDINNQYHGQGFTEWTNTSRTFPQFINHYQPHIPYDVGYYDLMNSDTLMRQSLLARMYGIYGFGFFYYWFSGKKIMERPLQLLLNHKEIQINYCLHWATDDWSMSWYGGDNKVILKQEIPETCEFWKDVVPYFMDERYIKIDGKPLFIVYKCEMFPRKEFLQFIAQLRQQAVAAGMIGLYVMITTGDGSFEDADLWAGDALVEYQPWKIYRSKFVENVLPKGYINPYFKGYISDLGRAIENKEYLAPHKCNTYFRSAMTSWDNSARKKETNAIAMIGNSPSLMKTWLIDIMEESRRIHSEEENIIFVSSWNEWAEGSHLEPDYRYGYAWLEAVKKALEESRE